MRLNLRPVKLALMLILSFLAYATRAQKTAGKKYPALLWEITGKDLQKPSYLFGTMHVSSKLVFHLSDSFYSAIKSVEMVALELDPQLWQDQMFRYQDRQSNLRMFTKGAPNDYIHEKTFQLEKYEEMLKAALSDEPTIINGLLYRTVQPRADFEENTYLDLYIYQTGKRLGKEATGVENYLETEKLILEAEQDMLKDRKRQVVDRDGDSMFDLERKTQEAYRKGDLDLLDSLEKLMTTSEAYMEKFLYRRNEIQARSIDSILHHHALFVGVGAAHLPGSRGVIELLRKKGYTLRPIMMLDRDASQRDDFEKIKVPVPFTPFRSEDGAFTVKLPGKLYRRVDSHNNDSWQYADMSNGAYYMVSRVKTHGYLLGNTKESLLSKVDSLLYENIPGKILKKTSIQKNGYPGYDITNKTRRGDLQRYNILVTPQEIFVFKMSGNATYVEGAEADQFFHSIELSNFSLWSAGLYSPSRGGFQVRLPQHPFENRDYSNLETNPRWEYESLDTNTGDAYIIWRKTIQNYHFMEEDSFELNMMEQSFRSSEFIDKQRQREQGKFKGYACLNASYLLKDGSYLWAKFLIKGPQYFVLAARSKDKNRSFADFFQSFSFLPFEYRGFSNYTDSFVNISVTTPVVPDIDLNVRNIIERVFSEEYLNAFPEYNMYWPPAKTAYFQDDTTGESVFVSSQSFPKYYYAKDSASFWEEEVNESKIKKDLIISRKEPFWMEDSVFGYKYVFNDTNSSRRMDSWIFLKGSRLYRVLSLNDSLEGESNFIRNFFSSIRPGPSRKGESPFTSKLDIFKHDFYGSDSVLSKKAKNAIPNFYFGAAGVPLLLNAIVQLSPKDKDYFSLKTKMINELGYIRDSSVVRNVVEGLKNIYDKTADTSTFQDAVLKSLAKNKTRKSYDLLKTLLIQDPPIFDNESDYNNLFRTINDSLALARTLFPELLQLFPVDDYKQHIRHLLTILVDSGYLKAGDYESSFTKIYFDAKIQLKKQLSREEQQLEKKGEENPAWERYDQSGIPGNDDYSDLEEYAILLMPYYEKNSAVPHFFDKLLQSRDSALQVNTAVLMLRNGHQVADSILKKLAGNDKYQFPLYRQLREAGLEKKFPASYLSQISMARSQLLSTKPKRNVYDVQFVDKKVIQSKQNRGYVYYFKYKFNKDEDWQIGISGIQPLNPKEVGLNTDLVKFTSKKIKPNRPVLEQYDEQLIRLLFSRHKSAAGFFQDNGYFIGRTIEE